MGLVSRTCSYGLASALPGENSQSLRRAMRVWLTARKYLSLSAKRHEVHLRPLFRNSEPLRCFGSGKFVASGARSAPLHSAPRPRRRSPAGAPLTII